MGVLERDIFLWLKRPTIAQMKEVLRWAHKRALRADIRCKDPGLIPEYPSEIGFDSILRHVDRKAKGFFRIIVRKGMNEMLRLDKGKQQDLLDICIIFRAGRGERLLHELLSECWIVGGFKAQVSHERRDCPLIENCDTLSRLLSGSLNGKDLEKSLPDSESFGIEHRHFFEKVVIDGS